MGYEYGMIVFAKKVEWPYEKKAHNAYRENFYKPTGGKKYY